jgi:hypothetical protein
MRENQEEKLTFWPLGVGKKPEKKALSLIGTHGFSNEDWTTEWFFGRK